MPLGAGLYYIIIIIIIIILLYYIQYVFEEYMDMSFKIAKDVRISKLSVKIDKCP